MRVSPKTCQLVFFLTSIAFALAACSQAPLRNSTQASIPFGFPTLGGTRTPIIRPAITKLPTWTPSWTPPATFPPDQVEALILELFETNGGCMFPCWWGIVPGKTSWESAQGFLEPFALNIEYFIPKNYEQVEYYAIFEVPDSISAEGRFRLSFILSENGIIKVIRTETPWAINEKDYSLSALLDKFGKPSEIRIKIIPDTPLGPLFIYATFFSDKGLLAVWERFGVLYEEKMELCPQENRDYPKLFMWSPQDKMTFDEVGRGRLTELNLEINKPFYPIENITNMSVNGFYETYLEENTDICVEIPINPGE